MARTIRLTEKDLTKIISKLISEQHTPNFDYVLKKSDLASYGSSEVSSIYFRSESGGFRPFLQFASNNLIQPTSLIIPNENELTQVCQRGTGDAPWDFFTEGITKRSRSVANTLFTDQQTSNTNYVLFESEGIPKFGKMAIGKLPESILKSQGKNKIKLSDKKIITFKDYFELKDPFADKSERGADKFYYFLKVISIVEANPV